MSTSPDMQKGGNFASRTSQTLPNAGAAANPGVTLLKGLVWLGVIAGAIAGIAMNYEIIWDLLVETLPVALEVAEETLDTFFEKVVGLNPGFAQIATAYTGVVILLAVFYLLSRKCITYYKKLQVKKAQLTVIYSNAWRQWFGGLRGSVLNWWDSLDTVNKVVAVVFGVLLGIPIALLISYALGSLVASLV